MIEIHVACERKRGKDEKLSIVSVIFAEKKGMHLPQKLIFKKMQRKKCVLSKKKNKPLEINIAKKKK